MLLRREREILPVSCGVDILAGAYSDLCDAERFDHRLAEKVIRVFLMEGLNIEEWEQLTFETTMHYFHETIALLENGKRGQPELGH